MSFNRSVGGSSVPMPIPTHIADEYRSLSMPPFKSHMSMIEVSLLTVSDKLDYRDEEGLAVSASILQKDGSNLKIHYDCYNMDTWSDYKQELHRFATFGSISKRKPNRLKHIQKGDAIDINPSRKHKGWRKGEIRKLHKKSGQVKIAYYIEGKRYLYWSHLDDINEIKSDQQDIDNRDDMILPPPPLPPIKPPPPPPPINPNLNDIFAKIDDLDMTVTEQQNIETQPTELSISSDDNEESLDLSYIARAPPPPPPPTIDIQQEIASKVFVPHMTLQEAMKLKMFDEIDYRDNNGKYIGATVIYVNRSQLKLQYNASDSREQPIWCDYRKELHRFAKKRSISQRPSHRLKRLKRGCYVDILPSIQYKKWVEGAIREIDGGQALVCWELMNRNNLYWVHLDNEQEIVDRGRKVKKKRKWDRNMDIPCIVDIKDDINIYDDLPAKKKRKLNVDVLMMENKKLRNQLEIEKNKFIQFNKIENERERMLIDIKNTLKKEQKRREKAECKVHKLRPKILEKEKEIMTLTQQNEQLIANNIFLNQQLMRLSGRDVEKLNLMELNVLDKQLQDIMKNVKKTQRKFIENNDVII